MRRSGRVGAAVWMGVCAAWIASGGEVAAQGKRKARPAEVHAVLINGGANRASNFLSHFEHMQEMRGALEARGFAPDRVALFNADGNSPELDMATREAAALPSGFWLVASSPSARYLKPATTAVNTQWEGARLYPARYGALREWFQRQRKQLKAGDTLVVYVTDHGQRGEESLDNGTINLWGETMSVLELRALLGYVPKGVRVVLLMSQCFSGSFAMSMYGPGEPWPQGNVCGYFSTTADRQAYGCYPEGRAQQRLGHAFTLIDALRQNPGLDQAHDQVSVYDSSPDVPLRTRDVFLERLLRQQADAQRTSLAALTDRLLAEAWADPARWRADLAAVDRIAAHYDLPSPRSLASLEQQSLGLQAARDAFDAQHQRWNTAEEALQRQLWQDFLASPDAATDQLALRLEPDRLKNATEPQRDAVLEAVIPAIERHARRLPARFARLQTFHGNAADAADARYRMDIRLAVNLRMRTRLLSIAGEHLLARPGLSQELARAAEALAALRTCEDAPLGALVEPAPPGAPPRPLVPLYAELERLEQLRPNRLGVRYGAADPDLIARYKLPAGAALIRAVEPGSPAALAGLREGDIALSLGRVELSWPDALRDVVMTSAPHKPLEIKLLRGERRERLALTLTRDEAPAPTLRFPIPPGAAAPPLEAGAAIADRAHVRLFLSRTCGDACVAGVVALEAWSRRAGVPWVIIFDGSDASSLPPAARASNAPVIFDAARARFDEHGIHGDPTFIAVDPAGVVRFRQVGYRLSETFTFEAWRPGLR